MSKAIRVTPKKRGRPATGGRAAYIALRLPAALIASLDKWKADNHAMSRSEAIRRLLELGLKADRAARE